VQVQQHFNVGSAKSMQMKIPLSPNKRQLPGAFQPGRQDRPSAPPEIKTLEAMAEALFRQWFVEPSRDGLPEGWRRGSSQMNLPLLWTIASWNFV
jgi:type I restriction enzyme S subunit